MPEDKEFIRRNTTEKLHTISKDEIKRCFDQRKTRWNNYEELQGGILKEISISLNIHVCFDKYFTLY